MNKQNWRLEVPAEFAAGVVGHAGAQGAAWLAALPDLVSELVARWQLTHDGDVMHGFLGVVVPVRRGSEAYDRRDANQPLARDWLHGHDHSVVGPASSRAVDLMYSAMKVI